MVFQLLCIAASLVDAEGRTGVRASSLGVTVLFWSQSVVIVADAW